jgi:hypothetical protein
MKIDASFATHSMASPPSQPYTHCPMLISPTHMKPGHLTLFFPDHAEGPCVRAPCICSTLRSLLTVFCHWPEDVLPYATTKLAATP